MLKRLVSIFLLLIFLFNVGGYHIMLWYISASANRQLADRLDRSEYAEDETIELRIAMALPYPSHPGQFQRVKGKFEYMGMNYQLVKQKFEGDTLIVVCIPDREEKRAIEFISDYARLVNELPAQSKTNLNNFAKTLQEFIPAFESYHDVFSSGWIQPLPPTSVEFQNYGIDLPILSPPPRG